MTGGSPGVSIRLTTGDSLGLSAGLTAGGSLGPSVGPSFLGLSVLMLFAVDYFGTFLSGGIRLTVLAEWHSQASAQKHEAFFTITDVFEVSQLGRLI